VRTRVLELRPHHEFRPVAATHRSCYDQTARFDECAATIVAVVFIARLFSAPHLERPMSENRVLVLGTRNAKKKQELNRLLAHLGVELRSLSEFPNAVDVVEDGKTFGENAHKKASQQAAYLGHWVLGEDSGLVVEYLNGAPGIYSARYSGAKASDESNNLRLLKELGDTPMDRRCAHYVCHVSLADPDGVIQADCESVCRGRIRFEAAGSGGFGYDPLFEVVEYHRTFGELGSSVKSVLSHRARALRLLLPKLQRLIPNW